MQEKIGNHGKIEIQQNDIDLKYNGINKNQGNNNNSNDGVIDKENSKHNQGRGGSNRNSSQMVEDGEGDGGDGGEELGDSGLDEDWNGKEDGSDQNSYNQVRSGSKIKVPDQYLQPYSTATIPQNLAPQIFISSNSKIEDLFEQMHEIVQQMLEKLSYIYQSQGIKSQLGGYLSTIIKIVTPVQLLTYIQYSQCSQQFKSKSSSLLCMHNSKKKQPSISNAPTKQESSTSSLRKSSTIKQIVNVNKMKTNNIIEETNRNRVYLSSNSYNPRFQDDDDLRYNSDDVKRGKKTLLDRNLQKKLCQWVANQARANRMPTRKDLVNQAKVLSGNNSNFRGSTGWCQHFLYRYPQVKKFILKTKIPLTPPPTHHSLPIPTQHTHFSILPQHGHIPIQPQSTHIPIPITANPHLPLQSAVVSTAPMEVPQVSPLFRNTMKLTDASFQRYSEAQNQHQKNPMQMQQSKVRMPPNMTIASVTPSMSGFIAKPVNYQDSGEVDHSRMIVNQNYYPGIKEKTETPKFFDPNFSRYVQAKREINRVDNNLREQKYL